MSIKIAGQRVRIANIVCVCKLYLERALRRADLNAESEGIKRDE
jgi:hypothetical protein